MPWDPERHGPQRVVGPGFHERVFAAVALVPPGHLTTYGDVAAHLGLRSVARHVGHALAALPGDREDVPWHRVVNSRGEIAVRGSGSEQVRRLRAEGFAVSDEGRVAGFARARFVFPSA